MNQAPAENTQPPAYYDLEYVNSLFEKSGLTNQKVSYLSGHSPTTIREFRMGNIKSLPIVFDIVIKVFDGSLERTFAGLEKFHRAARSESGSGAVSGRSTGGVGRSKPRSR